MTPWTLAEDGLETHRLADLPGQAWMAKAVHGAARVFRTSAAVLEAEQRLRTEPQRRQQLELRDGQVKLTKGQKTYLVQQPCEALQAWGLQAGVLTWLSDRLGGLVPALHSSHLWLALVPPVGYEPIMSQTWHRDPYESGMDRILKVFWYLHDVDEHTGPFEYLRGTQERTKPTGRALQDRYIAGNPNWWTNEPGWTVVTGPRDTVIVADTSGIHRGGFCRTTPRLSATLVYAGRKRLV